MLAVLIDEVLVNCRKLSNPTLCCVFVLLILQCPEIIYDFSREQADMHKEEFRYEISRLAD